MVFTQTKAYVYKDLYMGDFPDGQVVKNLPSNVEAVGLIPGGGTRIQHAVGHNNLIYFILQACQKAWSCVQMGNLSYTGATGSEPRARRNCSLVSRQE